MNVAIFNIIEANCVTCADHFAQATALWQRLLLRSWMPPGTGASGTMKSYVPDRDPPPATETQAGSKAKRPASRRKVRSMPRTLQAPFDRNAGIGTAAAEAGGTAATSVEKAGMPQEPRFLTASYTGHAGTCAYKLYVPGAYCGRPLPLIVMLHGCTQSADDFAAGTGMNAIGEAHACFVAYPAQPQSANGSKCWNWFSPSHQQRGCGEPSLIAGIATQIMRDFAIDRRRVYVAGLSAGGAAAVVLGATYPDIFAAIGVQSGLACGAARDVSSAFAAMRNGRAEVSNGSPVLPSNSTHIPTIVFHGGKDTTVHPRNGDQVIEQSRSRSNAGGRIATERGKIAGGHSYTQTSYLDAKGDVLHEMWAVHEAGHAWSGGSPAGSFTDPHGPDASREMLRFFLAHPQPAAVISGS